MQGKVKSVRVIAMKRECYKCEVRVLGTLTLEVFVICYCPSKVAEAMVKCVMYRVTCSSISGSMTNQNLSKTDIYLFIDSTF